MIEITREKSIYTYRLNPFNSRIIDRKENKHRAKWVSFATYASADIARAALLKLEARRKEVTP